MPTRDAHRLTGSLAEQLTGSLAHRLTGLPTYQLTDLPAHDHNSGSRRPFETLASAFDNIFQN